MYFKSFFVKWKNKSFRIMKLFYPFYFNIADDNFMIKSSIVFQYT